MNQSLPHFCQRRACAESNTAHEADSAETQLTLTFPTMKMFQLVTTALIIHSVVAILASAFARAGKSIALAGKNHVRSRRSSL